jgi:hypothetical protein
LAIRSASAFSASARRCSSCALFLRLTLGFLARGFLLALFGLARLVLGAQAFQFGAVSLFLGQPGERGLQDADRIVLGILRLGQHVAEAAGIELGLVDLAATLANGVSSIFERDHRGGLEALDHGPAVVNARFLGVLPIGQRLANLNGERFQALLDHLACVVGLRRHVAPAFRQVEPGLVDRGLLAAHLGGERTQRVLALAGGHVGIGRRFGLELVVPGVELLRVEQHKAGILCDGDNDIRARLVGHFDGSRHFSAPHGWKLDRQRQRVEPILTGLGWA